jgi:hypothetical protein
LTEGKAKIYKNKYCQNIVIFAGENEETKKNQSSWSRIKDSKDGLPETKPKVLNSMPENLVFNEATLLSIDLSVSARGY